MKNLKASKTSSVPSQMYFDRRGSSDGRKACSCRVRDRAVDPVGADDQVGVRGARAAASALKRSSHAERGGALLQRVEQRAPAERREAVAAGGDDLALVVDVDLGPAGELRRERRRTSRGRRPRCPRASRRRRRRRSRTCRQPRCARRRGPRWPGPGAWRGSRSTARPGHHPRSRSSRLLLLSRPDRAIIWARTASGPGGWVRTAGAWVGAVVKVRDPAGGRRCAA